MDRHVVCNRNRTLRASHNVCLTPVCRRLPVPRTCLRYLARHNLASGQAGHHSQVAPDPVPVRPPAIGRVVPVCRGLGAGWPGGRAHGDHGLSGGRRAQRRSGAAAVSTPTGSLSAAQPQPNDRGETNAFVPCLALRRAALKGATSSPNGEIRVGSVAEKFEGKSLEARADLQFPLSAAQPQPNDRGEINAFVAGLALRRAALNGATSSPKGRCVWYRWLSGLPAKVSNDPLICDCSVDFPIL